MNLVEIGNEPWNEDQIERSLADHLIGDPEIAAPSVMCVDRHVLAPKQLSDGSRGNSG